MTPLLARYPMSDRLAELLSSSVAKRLDSNKAGTTERFHFSSQGKSPSALVL
jgi:hypothetical protein